MHTYLYMHTFFTRLSHVCTQTTNVCTQTCWSNRHTHREQTCVQHKRWCTITHTCKHGGQTPLFLFLSVIFNLSHPHCCSNLLLFQKIRSKLVKLSRQLWPRWELEREEIPLSPLPKEGFLPHCCWVESKGCGVYLESCWCGNFWLWNNATLSKEG